MMTVILADDEPMIVRGLKKLIDWDKLNLQIIGTASNGAEALHLIREKHPDLLISDINMPEMNGIDLLKTLNHEDSSTQVIFISGFHDFEYAHAALKYGARDYLLKPIDEKQLESAIIKIVSRENLYPYLNDEAFHGDSKIKEPIATDFSMDLEGYFSIINCQIDDVFHGELSLGEKNILHFSVLNLIRDYFSHLDNHRIIDKKKDILVLLSHNNKDSLVHLQKSLLEKLVILVKENLKEKLIITTGKIVDNVQSINESYVSTLELKNLRYYHGDIPVLYYTRERTTRYSMEDLFIEQGKIIDSLFKYDKEIKQKIEAYMNVLKEISFGNKEATISYCLGTLVFIKKSLEERDLFSQSLDFDDRQILSELHKMESFDLLVRWIHELIARISSDIRIYQDTKIHPDIHKIKTYLADHFRENITLQNLSDLIFLHPNYLSGYFKKQTGQNFKDYLTDIRMEQAEMMLLSTDSKVYEIAEQVGFTDYRHFSEVFKKKFGVSPREYKKQISRSHKPS